MILRMSRDELYERVFAPLRGVRVWDVQLHGYIDRDRPLPRFSPMRDSVYLALAEGYVRIEAPRGSGQLSFRPPEDSDPVPPAHWDLEDDEYAVGSYGHDLLGSDGHAAAVTRVRYALDAASDPAAGTVRAAEIRFDHGGVLFVDPLSFDGIRLQGRGAYDRWLAWEREEADPPSAYGPVEDRTWTP